MKYLISILLIASFIFSGCGDKQPAVVDTLVCPRIEVLRVVPAIKVKIDKYGSAVSQSNTSNLIKGARQLRKSEGYYFSEITKYNKKYIKKDVDK